MPSSNATRGGKSTKEITIDKKSANNKKPAVSKSDILPYYTKKCKFEFHIDDQETNINYFINELNSILHEALDTSADVSFTSVTDAETKKSILCTRRPTESKPNIYVREEDLSLNSNWQVYDYFVYKERSFCKYKQFRSYVNYDKQMVITVFVDGPYKKHVNRLETLLSFTNHIKEIKESALLYDKFYVSSIVNNSLNTICYDKQNYSIYDYLKDFQQKNNFSSKYCNNPNPVQQSQIQTPTQISTQISTQNPTQISTQIPTQISTQIPTQIPTQPPFQLFKINPPTKTSVKRTKIKASTHTPFQQPKIDPPTYTQVKQFQLQNFFQQSQIKALVQKSKIETPTQAPTQAPTQVLPPFPALDPTQVLPPFPTLNPTKALPQFPTLDPTLDPDQSLTEYQDQSLTESQDQSLTEYQAPIF